MRSQRFEQSSYHMPRTVLCRCQPRRTRRQFVGSSHATNTRHRSMDACTVMVSTNPFAERVSGAVRPPVVRGATPPLHAGAGENFGALDTPPVVLVVSRQSVFFSFFPGCRAFLRAHCGVFREGRCISLFILLLSGFPALRGGLFSGCSGVSFRFVFDQFARGAIEARDDTTRASGAH